MIYLLGCSKKEPYPTHRGNFSCPERESQRGESYEECLKFVQDVHKGGIVNFLHGGIDIFLNNPFCGNIRKNYCQGINYHVFLTY